MMCARPTRYPNRTLISRSAVRTFFKSHGHHDDHHGYLWNSMCLVFIVAIMCLPMMQVDSLRIIDFKASNVVENGTGSVVLDCDFVFDPGEEPMFMKWHFKGQLVYQLIFSKNRISTLEPLKNFIDHTYSPPRVESKYRSIRLVKPTIQLHGPYSCRVDALTKDDAPSVTKKAHLVVYSRPKYFDFVTDNSSSVICRASGIYPSPVIELYRYGSENETNQILVSRQPDKVFTNAQGEYTVELRAEVDDSHLRTEIVTHYECILTIPGTNFSKSKVLAFQKGWNKRRGSNMATSSLKLSHLSVGIYLILSLSLVSISTW
ncbi:uncharacterized protein LOC141857062 [Brevipalpus obovatus]|uniref:uncharacterized protein LOC141857062 n=1 Tax=Brevipalpus obovatus TaxID=246614 RepID=UPI003D9EE1AC